MEHWLSNKRRSSLFGWISVFILSPRGAGLRCGILDHVRQKILSMMNETLAIPCTADEVRWIVFMMGLNKALGPDGLTAGFYQHYWDVIGPRVAHAILDFSNGGDISEDTNQTTIVRIPNAKTHRRWSKLNSFLLAMSSTRFHPRCRPIDCGFFWIKSYLRSKVHLSLEY